MSVTHILEAKLDGESITITDPRDGGMVGTVRSAGAGEVADAVRRAGAAFTSWSRLPSEDRGAMVRHAAGLVAANAPELAELNSRETGRPTEEALEGVRAGVRTLLQFAELGPLHRGHSLRGAVDAADYTIPEPRGVVLALTPWNDPVATTAGLVGAALVTGNTVIHKPSERCPHLGARLGELLAQALPIDVIQTLLGGPPVGNALAEHPGIDLIAHVGSTLAGEQIARTAALTGSRVVRENGGNDPLIVDADVEPEWAAAQAALGAFANAGQLCTSVERIFVHEAIAAEFTDGLVREAERLHESDALGPLVDDALRLQVHGQVADSLSRGAIALCGGAIPPGPGSYYPPTVLTGCTTEMPVMSEETFGPVAPIQVVRGFEEGLELAARGRYGLTATVLTRSMENAQRAIAGLPVGTVKINAVFGGAPGGSAEPRGDSGSGYGYGPELLDEMTTTKVVHVGIAPRRDSWRSDSRPSDSRAAGLRTDEEH
ncbi:Acyl-CoA reductase [Leifsonia sp. CL147]|nr:Acyl-CoA reductase [Leifsonia sp. CL154]SFL24453.1 Acyl-CoA reductase [Leifsonia sp. CL147]